MANRDWLGLKNELPKQRRLVLVALSFVVPLLLWSAVSYVPWLWHPLVRVTAPGDVDYFVEDMEVPRDDFDHEMAKVVGQLVAVGRKTPIALRSIGAAGVNVIPAAPVTYE